MIWIAGVRGRLANSECNFFVLKMQAEFKRQCLAVGLDADAEPLEISQKLAPRDQEGGLPQEVLNLSGNSCSLKALTALANSLETDTTIHSLILADSFLGDEGAIILATALKLNKGIHVLDLRGNNIRCDGAVALAQMLKTNNTLSSLLLEWNCLGIWDLGIKTLADSLSLNHALQTLDLRNCKIGPRGAQALALGIKHNTALRTLDLRWNNAGLVGGRAIADMLQWNMHVHNIDLAGNEVPDEVSRSIAVMLQRNKDRFTAASLSSSHSEQLSSTLQTLAKHHQQTVEKLQTKLTVTDGQAHTLSERLAIASREISASQSALKSADERANNLSRDFGVFKAEANAKISELQRDLLHEREKRVGLEEQLAKASTKINSQFTEFESSLHDKEVKNEVLRRDKTLLLEEIEKLKKREKDLQELHNEKMGRAEVNFQNKMAAMEALKDAEIHDKIKKSDERYRQLESANLKLLEEFDSVKAKAQADRRHLLDEIDDTENRIRKEEEIKRRDIESQLETMRLSRDQIQADLTSHITTHNAQMRDRDAETKRNTEQRVQTNEQLVELKTQLHQGTSELGVLRSKLEQMQRSEREGAERERVLAMELARLREEMQKSTQAGRAELEKVVAEGLHKDGTITKLRETVRRLEQDLFDERDDQNLRMKELSAQINTLITQRKRDARRAVEQ